MDEDRRCKDCRHWTERGRLGMVLWIDDDSHDPRRWGSCSVLSYSNLHEAPTSADTPGAVGVTKDGYKQYIATTATFGCVLFASEGLQSDGE